MAQVGVARHSADLRQHSPAALASIPRCGRYPHADIRNIGNCKGTVRRRFGPHRSSRSDAELRKIDITKLLGQHRRDEELDGGLQARPQTFRTTLELERAGHDATQIAQLRPAFAKRVVAPSGWDIGEQLEMDAASRPVTMTGQPSLLGGEANHRSEPTHEAVKAAVEHRPHRAPADVVRRIAIEPVLADVEIE